MPRYLIQLNDGSERTIEADRLELAPPIQTCRFHVGDSTEDLALETIRNVSLLDADEASVAGATHGSLEVSADPPGIVEISQPNLLQPDTTAVIFIPRDEVEWLIGELRRVRATLPGARAQRKHPERAGESESESNSSRPVRKKRANKKRDRARSKKAGSR